MSQLPTTTTPPTCKRCGGPMLLLDGEWECHNAAPASAPAIAPTPSAQAKCEANGTAYLQARNDVDQRRIARLETTLKNLSFAAQITGGVAGRDDALVAAIDEAAKVLNPNAYEIAPPSAQASVGSRPCFAIPNQVASDTVKPFGAALEVSARIKASAQAKCEECEGRGYCPETPGECGTCDGTGRVPSIHNDGSFTCPECEHHAAPPPAQARDEDVRCRQFWNKHGMPPMLRPSCLVCGKQPEEWPPAIQHMELRSVIVCAPCRDAATAPVSAQAREALEAGAAALEHVATGHNLHTTTGFEHARILRSLSVGGVAIPLGTITPAMVHKMCHYLNGEKADSNACAKCPVVEKTRYGDGERGCYGIAFETLQMARCFMYEGATGAVASQWRDIATAPTEVGSCVIVLCEGWKSGSEACLHDEGWHIAGNDPTDSWGPGRLDPTKWQPLPAAPGADSAPVSA